MQQITIQFPGLSAHIPSEINSKPVQFATIDEDGALIAWACDETPVFDDDLGAWCADTFDMQQVGNLSAQMISVVA